MEYDASILKKLASTEGTNDSSNDNKPLQESAFKKRDLSIFATYDEAYHQLIKDIMHQQVLSTQLVLAGSSVKKIFVDGGFSQNPIYLNLLAAAFQNVEVYGASISQSTALGAALAVHHYWNKQL